MAEGVRCGHLTGQGVAGPLGADEAAAELVGAIETTTTAARVYGADATRQRAATGRLRDRLGEAAFLDAHERGRRMDDTDAVDAALTAIDRLRTTTT